MYITPPAKILKGFQRVDFEDEMDGRVIHLHLLENVSPLPDSSRVTSVAVIPFTERESIVATQLKRGIDIPGGHVEEYDDTLTATVSREAKEEAGITLDDKLYILGIIASDYKGDGEQHRTYMLIYAGKVKETHDYTPQLESLGREVTTLDNFLSKYEAGSRLMMAELINRAKGLSNELFPGAK